MFTQQKGCSQSIIYFVGLIVAGFFFIVIMSNLRYAIAQGLFIKATGEQLIRSIALLLLFAFIGSLGFILIGFFPAIRVDNSGIKAKYPLLVEQFKWEEIEGIERVHWPNGAIAVILSPKGNFIMNFFKFYPQHIHGLLVRVYEPVIILSTGIENRELILEKIKNHMSKKLAELT